MSLKPVHITQAPFFYAAGNTPAVCLTQSLPPEQDAALLLLGCGDIRNILFTLYSGSGTDGRKLDFTCCDLEAEIIARNALALTAILDDTKGAHVQLLWNLYYHIFIDSETLTLLQFQARKLLDHAESLAKWEQGPYGNMIRFCDNATFANVVKLWELYAIEPNHSRYKEVQEIVKRQWDAAKCYKNYKISEDGSVLDGLRSSAPLLSEGVRDLPKQYKTFWASGTCYEDKKVIKKLTIANPMFACRRSGLTLHYGSDPLWGFHLALAHAHLSAESPLRVPEITPASEKGMPKVLRAALTQFGAWCNAFRNAIGQVTVRYVNSDAMAFCHALQHHRTYSESRTANLYRANWNYTALVLDSTDYADSGGAPMSFDVIDTSNLVDHLGNLNLIAATRPLLRSGPSSTLRTEMLLPREYNVTDSAKTLLSGDLLTMALLLGLKPPQYWANATATWHINESMLKKITGADAIGRALSRHIVIWKLSETADIKYDATELANFIYNLYVEMFQDESWSRKLEMLAIKNKDALLKKFQSYEVYTRASLAVILRHIKNAEVVDWPPFIKRVVDNILTDQTLNMGPHHFQSLFVHLDMLGLHTLEEYPNFHRDLRDGIFRRWTNMPTVVCVTLVVSHSVVAMFDDINDFNGTPLCQLQLRSSVSMQESIYPDVQLGFGTVTTAGTPHTNEYSLCVTEDQAGCKGNSPLIVSAMVSTGSLIEYGDRACVVMFGLKPTPANTGAFASRLGLLLHLHTSAVGQKDVFVTRFRPNMAGHPSVQCAAASAEANDQDVTVAFRPCFDPTASRITSLQTRYDVNSLHVTTALQNAAIVEIQLPNPSSLVLKVGSTFQKHLELPLPLNGDHGKTKIARKSRWVEYTAPITEPRLLASRPDSVFPIRLSPWPELALDHLHYVFPGVLPKVHIGKTNTHAQWLTAVTSTAITMSAPELVEYEKAMVNKDPNKAGRLGVKESIFSMFMHMLGLQNLEKTSIFGLEGGAGHFASIFVDTIRMDVSNQTVFLDAACISLHDQLDFDFGTAMSNIKNQNIILIKADTNEVSFWKHLLPAFAERCRQWKHKPTCEYKSTGRVPLLTEADKRCMCSCGLGVFPDGYLKDLKQFPGFSRFAVRVAIPVIFASPISPEDAGATLSSPPSRSMPTHQSAVPVAPQQNERTSSRVDDLDAKKDSCFACGAKSAKDGAMLMRCSSCKFAQYCSPECQTKDWKKEHKHICKQLKQMQAYE